MIFDRIAILDWSAANRPRRGKDSIWLGHDSAPPENLPTRATAFDRLTALVEDALTRNQRLLIGADFAFGYPRGFARALTGQDNALALWQQLADRLQDDARNRSNRLEVAAEINRGLPGLGPFWFNP
ncbi:MAG: molybdopterin guanine dinucleotide synthesis, partial [Rhodobacteraceae bacterium]|nr:molybdopterin guanine dinucleotide synthesis [Paracoccaceae bacterium]